MNSKHTKAIVLSLISSAVLLAIIVSLLSGAISVHVLFDQPINVMGFMLAALAIAAVIIMSMILGAEKGRSCKNRSCSFNPHYVEAVDSTYKEMTGVLDMSELIAAEAPMGIPQTPVTCSAARPPAVSAAVKTSPAPEAVASNVAQSVFGAAQIDLETNPAALVAGDLTTNKTQMSAEMSAVDLDVSSHLLNSDAFEDIEEPHERPSMDFTDDMVPLIIANLHRLNMETMRKNASASSYALGGSGSVADKSATAGNFVPSAYGAFIASRELSARTAAIEWLFEAPERKQTVTSGKHFKAAGTPGPMPNVTAQSTPQLAAQFADQSAAASSQQTAQPPHLKLLVAS